MYLTNATPQEIRWQKRLGQQARILRKNPTSAEEYLWKKLRGRQLLNFKFRRQFPLYNSIADFYCHAKKLIIEVDGPIHEDRVNHDVARDHTLKEVGYTVIRFTNDEVINDIDKVIQKLTSLLTGGGAEH